MKTIRIGPEKIEVPIIIHGLMRISLLSVDELGQLLDFDIENNLTYLDTSDIYANGYCEELLGKTFAARPGLRNKFILQTKCGIIPSSRGFSYYDLSEDHIMKAVDASLKRLKTDHIDYYLLHRPDALMEPEDIAAAFDKLYQSGKVSHFGVSNFNASQFNYLKQYVNRPIEINQLQFSPAHTLLVDSGICTNRVETSSLDHDQGIINTCRMNDCAIQAWSPYRAAKSKLTCSVIDRYGQLRIETRPYLNSPEFPELNAKLKEFAERFNVSPAAIVLAWILRFPGRMQVVLGSTKPERILDSCQGLNIELTREDWYEIYIAGGNFVP